MAFPVALRSGYLTETALLPDGKLSTIPELLALRLARLGGILASADLTLDSWGRSHAIFEADDTLISGNPVKEGNAAMPSTPFPSQGLQVNDIV